MTEFTMRDILLDWLTEIGVIPVPRATGMATLRSEIETGFDAYDRAITFAEKRLGLTFPTLVEDHDLLLECAAKLWLCNRILAREIGSFDVDQKKLAQIFSNVRVTRDVLDKEFDILRTEVWGAGKRNGRTTTGDLGITMIAVVSASENEIAIEDVLEL